MLLLLVGRGSTNPFIIIIVILPSNLALTSFHFVYKGNLKHLAFIQYSEISVKLIFNLMETPRRKKQQFRNET